MPPRSVDIKSLEKNFELESVGPVMLSRFKLAQLQSLCSERDITVPKAPSAEQLIQLLLEWKKKRKVIEVDSDDKDSAKDSGKDSSSDEHEHESLSKHQRLMRSKRQQHQKGQQHPFSAAPAGSNESDELKRLRAELRTAQATQH